MPKKRICVILESAEELHDMIRKKPKGRFRDRLCLSGLPETGKAESTAHARNYPVLPIIRRRNGSAVTETVPGWQRAISGEVPIWKYNRELV